MSAAAGGGKHGDDDDDVRPAADQQRPAAAAGGSLHSDVDGRCCCSHAAPTDAGAPSSSSKSCGDARVQHTINYRSSFRTSCSAGKQQATGSTGSCGCSANSSATTNIISACELSWAGTVGTATQGMQLDTSSDGGPCTGAFAAAASLAQADAPATSSSTSTDSCKRNSSTATGGSSCSTSPRTTASTCSNSPSPSTFNSSSSSSSSPSTPASRAISTSHGTSSSVAPCITSTTAAIPMDEAILHTLLHHAPHPPSTATATSAPARPSTRPSTTLHPTSPPTTLPSTTDFSDLPAIAIHSIATTTGRGPLSTLCKCVSAACPPLDALRPDGLTTPCALACALTTLARRHAPSLTALDLRHTARLLTPAHLPLLSAAVLPRLSSLTLHRPPPTHTLAIVTHAATRLPLTALDLRPCTPATLAPVLAHLTALRSLTLSLPCPPVITPHLLQLSTVRHLTHLALLSAHQPPPHPTPPAPCPLAPAALLSATATLPHLQTLILTDSIPLPLHPATANLLARHTSLTHLAITTCKPAPQSFVPTPTPAAAAAAGTSGSAAVLQAVGSLGPRLQHLCLALPDDTCMLAVDACLAQLTRLQSLSMTRNKALRLQTLAVHCSGLTALRCLASPYIDCFTEPGLLAIMALTTRLKMLHLEQDSMQIGCLHIVTSMSGLTELQLGSKACTYPCHNQPRPLLGALPVLRTLRLQGGIGRWVLANGRGVGLAALTALTALALVDCQVDDAALAGLVRGMRHLEVLDLQGNGGVGGQGLRALTVLPRLRELALTLPRQLRGAGPLPCLVQPPPPSLCRVFISSEVAGRAPFEDLQAAAEVGRVLVPCCEVVYGRREWWQ